MANKKSIYAALLIPVVGAIAAGLYLINPAAEPEKISPLSSDQKTYTGSEPVKKKLSSVVYGESTSSDSRNQTGSSYAAGNDNRTYAANKSATNSSSPPQAASENQKKQNPENNQKKEAPELEVVTPYFTADLATFIVSRYHPAESAANPGSQGMLALNLKSVNMRYGIEMTGLETNAPDIEQARVAVFEQLYRPEVLKNIYKYLAPEFVYSLGQALEKVKIRYAGGASSVATPAQQKEFYRLISQKMADLGRCMHFLGSTPLSFNLTGDYIQKTNAVNNAYFLFWKYKDNGNPGEIKKGGKLIKEAIIAREKAKQDLKKELLSSVHPLQSSGDEMIYLAQWVYRRGQGKRQTEAAMELGRLFAEMSSRLDQLSQK